MKKLLISLTAFICLMAMLVSLPSCGGTTENETTGADDNYHTVTFNSNGGSAVESVKIKHGHHASAPSDPILENHVFCYWLLNGNRYFFDVKKIESDITLDAYWISADTLFGLTPIGNDLGITEITQQLSFDTLMVPSVINGKNVVAILDGACDMIHDGYADVIFFPETVTSIGKEALASISETKIKFLGTITSIGESAFDDCQSLSEIKLGVGLKSIPFRAFAGCTSLKTLDIPEGVTTIEENALENTKAMLTVVFPSTLTTIENGAFEDAALKTIFFKGTEEQFDKLDIASGNDCVTNAKVYFYSETEPTEDGNYWHYDKSNSPVTW